ncbi:MAG: amidohydrolase family protein [Anaerolineae bacterium]
MPTARSLGWSYPEMHTLLTADRLFDGERAIRGGAVLIDGAKIVAAGSAQEIGSPSGVSICAFGDATLLPGLIDCHDHLAYPSGDLAERANTPISRAVLETAANLRLTLERGFTAIRDCAGVDQGVKQAAESGLILSPRLRICLVIITQTAGLADGFIPATGLRRNVPRLPGIPDGVADGTDAVRAKVREIIRAGADFLKIATTGDMSTGAHAQRQFTLDEVAAVVEEGRAFGLPTAAHAYSGPGLKNALQAGVHSVEHLGPVEDEDLVFMAEQGIYLVPTLSAARHISESARPEEQDSPRVRNARRFVDLQKERLQRARQLGVQICLGTDIGDWVRGENAGELEYLADTGLTPLEALRAGTSTAAACLGMADQIGRLAPGYQADVVAVLGDATGDVSLLREPKNIRAVLLGGNFVVQKECSTDD